MSIEISASRVLAPAFGSGIYVWGSIIGIIMAALSIGYFFGGRFADQDNKYFTIPRIFVYSATWVAVLPVIGEAVGTACVFAGFVAGPLISTIILFTFPAILLSMISPMIIKQLSYDVKTVGTQTGNVFAISTVGSIIATFATSFLLLPTYGTKNTLIFTAILLFIAAIYSGLKKKDEMILILSLFAMPIAPFIGVDFDNAWGNRIFETESAYNIIRVYETESEIVLKMGSEFYLQSRIPRDGTEITGDLFASYYTSYYNIGPLINEGKQILWLGLAAGSTIKDLKTREGVHIDGVEIDPKMVDAGKRFFKLKEDEKFRIYIEDGRQFLKTSGVYDIINIDVYSGGGEIPNHMASKEFMALCADHLSDDGIMMMNILDLDRQKILTKAIVKTVETSFKSTFIIPIGPNNILLATKNEKSIEEIKKAITKNKNPKFDNMIKGFSKSIYSIDTSDANILTDDLSNIEQLTFYGQRQIFIAEKL